MSKSNKLLFSQGTRETTETKPPSFIHKYRELARAPAGLCARHLFSFQDQASSPADREMSCRDAIVGHSASREWTAEIQSRFSFYFWHRIHSGLCGLTAKGQGRMAWEPVLEYPRGTEAGPGRAWGKGGRPPWLRLVHSVQGEGILVSTALLPLVLVGEEVQSAFQLRNH